MAINNWWADDPGQRYWMEITDRTDLGADLLAPTRDGANRPYWGYELVTYVQPGDVVFHWHKNLLGAPGIVARSVASGEYEDTEMEWQAHGTTGRLSARTPPRPAWRMPLASFAMLDSPRLIDEIRAKEDELRSTFSELTERVGAPLYYPFGFSDSRPLRAQQTYFVKLPAEVARILGLSDYAPPAEAPASASPKRLGPRRRPGSGYVADSVLRSAIEWRAVNVATETYVALGYAVEYTGATQPYDLEVSVDDEVRRVEVKGSSGSADSVELTIGEVRNSRDKIPTDLMVVDGIQWRRESDGSINASGGEIRWWPDWAAEDGDLSAIRFRYALPSGAKFVAPEGEVSKHRTNVGGVEAQ